MRSAPSCTAATSAAELMADPLFRLGHDHVWDGRGALGGLKDESERLAYRRGRDFAEWLKSEGEQRQRFSRGGVINAEIASLIVYWQAQGLSAVIA
jgi:hypothetical protein